MTKAVAIPRLGLTMEEATIVEWKAREGEQVGLGQELVSIEMDKAIVDLEALNEGLLHIVAKEAQVVPVGGLIAVLAETPEEYQGLVDGSLPLPGLPAPATQLADQAPTPASGGPVAAASHPSGKIKASPLARRLAEQQGIDLATVVGTRPGGAIGRDDVERAIQAKATPAAAEGATPPTAAGRPARARLPLQGMRKAIAQNMPKSLQQTAQMTQCGDIDILAAIALRSQLNANAAEDERITFSDLFVKAIALAMTEHPAVNASLEGEELVIWQDVDVAVAVYVEEDEYSTGILMPVVRNADKKSLREIHRELGMLADAARRRRLSPKDMDGASVAFTNLGSAGVGGIYGTPILPVGCSAIVQVTSVMERPAVRNGQLEVRPLIAYGLTVDHRVIDGVPAGRFMETVRRHLEDPENIR